MGVVVEYHPCFLSHSVKIDLSVSDVLQCDVELDTLNGLALQGYYFKHACEQPNLSRVSLMCKILTSRYSVNKCSTCMGFIDNLIAGACGDLHALGVGGPLSIHEAYSNAAFFESVGCS